MIKMIWTKFRLYFVIGAVVILSAFIGKMVYEITTLTTTNAGLVTDNSALRVSLASVNNALAQKTGEMDSLQESLSLLSVKEDEVRSDFDSIYKRWNKLKNENQCTKSVLDVDSGHSPINLASEWVLLEDAYCTASGDCLNSPAKAPDSSSDAR